jgi:photosystem II stability/assembly factor-like uncharacterized protein
MLHLLLSLLFLLPQPPEAAPQPKSAPAPKKEAKKEEKGFPVGGFRLRNIGPAVTSGRIVGLAVHPQDKAHYYVAVASGGVWKTVNSGTTWTPIFDGEGSYSIGYITLDPKNPNTVWVGTGENNSQRSVAYGDGVYKSIDGGRSWQNVGLKTSEHIGKIIIDPRNSDVVYAAAQGPLWSAGGDRGLYKTTDGGKSWNRILNIDEHTGVTDVILDPRNPDVLIAATYQRRRHVWTLINGGPGSGIHRSTDGGKSWTKLSAGLPGGDLGRIGLAYAPTDPDVVYATVEAAEKQGGIFRSTDRGITWEKRNPFDQGAMYYGQIVADPVNKDRLYVMNVFIQVSDDGGRTLKSLGERFKHVDNHCMWIDPKNPNYYLVGCDGGVYESFDRAGNWHFKSNLPVTQFYDIGVDQNPISGKFYHVYGGTQDNYTLGGPVRTRSGHGITNADWYVVQGGDGFHCKVDPTDPNIVYGEYQYGGLCRYDRKTGNRVEIQPQAAPGEAPLRWNWDSPFIISPHAPKRLYFAANKLFRSEDRGNSWTAVSGDLTRQLDRDKLPVMGKIWNPEAVSKHQSTSFYGNIVALAESPKKEGLLYVGTDDGLIQISTDGGKTWTKTEKFPGVPANTYVSKIVASEHDANTVYASFDNHKQGDFKPYLFKSTDAGKTWQSLSETLPERGTVYSLAEDPVRADMLFCGTEFALYVSFDSGKKWQRLRSGLPTIQVKDLVVQKHNSDLVVGTFGRGFYVIDDYSAMREFTPQVFEKAAHLFKVSDVQLYIPSGQYGGGGKGFLGASFYTAENPPYGAAITVHVKSVPETLKAKRKKAEQEALKAKKPIPYPTPDELRAEAEEEAPQLLLTITDSTGSVLRVLPVGGGEGVHRANWDLREAGVSAGEEFPSNGPLVMPGRYSVELGLRANGKYSSLAGPVSFNVLADPLSGLKEADYTEIAAFNKQVKALRKSLVATSGTANELSTKLDAIRSALEGAPASDEAAKQSVRNLQERLKLVQRALQGDRILASRNENVPESISARISTAASANEDALALPTGTQKQAYTDASKLLGLEITKLRAIIEKELPELEKKLEALGAAWTPGRLPKLDGK